MLDYRLKVFYAVATRLSFTKAAEELHITQPAVTKHIKLIEAALHTKLFDRNGTAIQLTQTGKLLQEYTEKIRHIYRDLEFEINQVNLQYKGRLNIGASTTIAHYILPEILAKFHAYHPEIKIAVSTQNTETITSLLKKNKIDVGIIEGASQSAYFNYIPFKKDEIVLVAKAQHPLAKKSISLPDLYKINLLFREQGSGTQEFIENQLQASGIAMDQLKVVMQMGSSEGIKNYLLHSDCMAFLSISTVLQELKHHQLSIIDIKNFSINRWLHFIVPKGSQSEVIRLLLRFVSHN